MVEEDRRALLDMSTGVLGIHWVWRLIAVIVIKHGILCCEPSMNFHVHRSDVHKVNIFGVVLVDSFTRLNRRLLASLGKAALRL
jgi:hypothetical protein